MKRISCLLSLCILVATGCSLKNETGPGNSLSIRLEESAEQVIESSPLSAFYKLPTNQSHLTDVFTLTVPSTINDFSCFVANVTGVGVPSESEDLNDCVIADNMNGVGAGTFSEDFGRGQVTTVEVPSGPARRIDIYGIYPGGCGGGGGGGGGGSDGGYYLGGVTQNLEGGESVVVPISYSGRPASVTCTDSGGGGGGGGGFYMSGVFPYGGNSGGGWGMAVNGNGFGAATTVTVDGTNCPVTSFSANTVLCTVPAGTAGSSKTVTVDNGAGLTASINYFSYTSPGISFISVDKNTSNVDFGTILASSGSANQTITFANMGDTAASATAADINSTLNFNYFGATFPGGGTCGSTTTLNPFQSCTAVITFDPVSIGAKTATFTMYGMPLTLNGIGN